MNETQQLEDYLFGRLDKDDHLVMDAKLIIDAELREKLLWQQKTYSLIKEYGRKSLKQEIEKVHALIFSESRFDHFRKKIKQIFNK